MSLSAINKDVIKTHRYHRAFLAAPGLSINTHTAYNQSYSWLINKLNIVIRKPRIDNDLNNMTLTNPFDLSHKIGLVIIIYA
ncbi:hypothetical protein CRN84_00620 [Budvicia aquatica]|uniref:Uncharacterized protein n=1 Tax=Budvicia aquatica TaxID=82979 RepID=A0A2C6DHP3_9GAMM|nr:hypothetical protein CRN84_00620 [Budvicia aquatica]